jgi:CubicO group peptidase (beta-lactamase class C family)
MRTGKIFILFIITLIAASAAFAQDNAKKIDELLKNYHDFGQFNGAVLVGEKGKVVYAKGFGMANMEWAIPVQADTKFRIGSVTKQLTAAVILQLAAEGKIKLDGKITDYLPDYRKDTGDKVTVHQLLNHTSGIPSYTGNPDFFPKVSRNPYTVADFVKAFSSGDFEFEPGTKFKYNNSGYFLLGAIIEKVTGKTYEAVLKERIFEPLGMTNTGYDKYAEILTKRAGGYEKTPDGYRNAAYLDMSLPYAAGSLYSTVEDLYKWDQALYADKILSAESKKLMFTPGLAQYGYGFFIAEQPLGKAGEKTKLIQHSGGINGFNSLLTRLPDKQQTVIILDNVGLGRYQENITNSIVNIINGQPFDTPKKSIAETLFKIVREKDAAATVAEYRRLKTENSVMYDFSESELNTLGYQLLGMKRVKDAIEILKLNVEIFPKSSNPYDSLGEAYLADNQKELALANYKKAVVINPENTAAVQIINRLEGREVKIDSSVFDSYVGEYELAPTFILAITKEGDKLFGQATGQGKLQLEPVSESQFTVPAAKANVSFEKDSAGKIIGLSLVQGGRTTKGKKIK